LTNYSFKNGITVIIPDEIPNLFQEWTSVKVAMSLILDPPEPVQPKVRKLYTLTKEGIRKRRKSWRSQKQKK